MIPDTIYNLMDCDLMMNDHELPYIIWDGEKETAYLENEWHDCLITYDMDFVSIQSIRKMCIAKGIVPTLVLACKSGQAAMQGIIDGRGSGVFTHYWTKVWRQNPKITLRQAVSLTNRLIEDKGFTQCCETICRVDLLDRNLWIKLPNACHCLMIFDMCRTPGIPGTQVIEFS
jgi:hypothetical protein